MQPPINWLMETGDSWVRFQTATHLLHSPEDELCVLRAAMLHDLRIQALVQELQDWPGIPINSHKKAGHPLHKLAFLAEIGLTLDDPGIETIVTRALERQAPNGAFQVTMQIKEAYGGSGQPMLSWALCDAPLVLWALCRLGAHDDEQLARAVDHLRSEVRANGWPCSTDPALHFRGPGRKSDPCPYATLLGLKALAAYGLADDPAVEAGIGALLWHWDVQKEHSPYMFGIGADFRKPKFPLVWYDLLHVIDVLSQFPAARSDPRYQAMLAELMQQADDSGRFTAASMYQDWKNWEFADKKHPSPAITLIAWRAAGR